MEPAAAFHVLDGPQAGLVVPVQRGWASSACATARAIVLPGVAARARIWLHDGCVTIEPRGTFVRLNGRPVSTETAVHDGDRLHVLDHDGTEVVLQYQQAGGRTPGGRVLDVTHEVLSRGPAGRVGVASGPVSSLARTPAAWRIAQAWLGLRRLWHESGTRRVAIPRPLPVAPRVAGPRPAAVRATRHDARRVQLRVVGGRDHRPEPRAAVALAPEHSNLPGRLNALGVALVLLVLALALLRPSTRAQRDVLEVPVSDAIESPAGRTLSDPGA